MPAERHESTVPRPGAPELYDDFPAHLTADGDCWYRVHRREHSPWWYSCSPGRFNLRAPRGTLNTASDPSCAAREMLGPRLVGGHRVPGAHVAGLVITALSLPPLRAADLLSGRAPRYGLVAGDMSAPREDAYALTRDWAGAFDEAGFDAVRSRSRFGTGETPLCLYVFGPAGEHEGGRARQHARLGAFLEEELGLAVDPVPHSADLVVRD